MDPYAHYGFYIRLQQLSIVYCPVKFSSKSVCTRRQCQIFNPRYFQKFGDPQIKGVNLKSHTASNVVS